MGNPRIPLEAGGHYHIYNHAVGKEDIFREDENYQFFLRKFASRITPFADVFAYCLMGNHFHFIIRIKSHSKLAELWQNKIEIKKKKQGIINLLNNFQNIVIDEIIINEFAKLFNSYAQAYNKKYFRQGALLKESFQRKSIDNSDYLLRLICYVHNNPVNDGFALKASGWKYSSFNSILSNKKTAVMRDEVLEMFGGVENFAFMYQKYLGFEI